MTKPILLTAMALYGFCLTACQNSDSSQIEKNVSQQENITVAPNLEAMKDIDQKITLNPTKNAYFGDLHVHTKNSFDAFIVGTRTSADDAYRFAQGEAIDNGAGELIQLSGPALDFYGVTDHGEYMGVIAAMRDKDNPISRTKTAKSIFGLLAGDREARRNAFLQVGLSIVTSEPLEDIYDRDFIDSAWAENVAAAEAHNKPGKFTTFAGYEFTSMQLIGAVADNSGALNLHRNVIFADKAPSRIFTTLDSNNPEDLWDWMNSQRETGYDLMAIPHNSNASNGQMFADVTIDGSAIREGYALNRVLNEPLVEISQVKGTSETHPRLSPNDEWADHELYEILIGAPVKSLIKPGSFVRQSLGKGLKFKSELSVNPYKFGLIGSTDAHVSASSLSEEDFFGKFSTDLDVQTRGSVPPKGKKEWEENSQQDLDFIAAPQYAAAGLAGVWARANTRDELFNSMLAKEVFATSGPRIKVRFFASEDFQNDIIDKANMIDQAYAQGVPMGGTLESQMTSPEFLIWAARDPQGVALNRLQIIKVTAEGERIYDVACPNGKAPDEISRRCVGDDTSVDLSSCEVKGGVPELKTVWRDPDWQKGQAASYYVRALEIPKCRWSTWDAILNGTPPNPSMKAIIQDRAWSSPIWIE